MLIYLAVQHDDADHDEAIEHLLAAGHTVIDDGYVDGVGFAALQRCDAVYTTEASARGDDPRVGGVLAYAEAERIPIHVGAVPPKHRTETTSPVQVDAFVSTVMAMYRLHLRKNADYSPANILGTGSIGVVVRLWDKMARLFSLSGFNVAVQFQSYEGERANAVKDESLDDTLLDLAVYGIIARLLRAGKWGR